MIVFILGFGGTMWYHALYKIAFIQSFDIEVKTVEGRRVGFNADPTLHFGKIPASGGTAEKTLQIGNDREMPLMVQIKISGDAARFIKVEDNGFIVEPGSSRSLKMYAIIPEDYNKIGNYTGEARIFYIRT